MVYRTLRQNSNGFIIIEQSNIMFLSFDGAIHFVKEIETATVVDFFLSNFWNFSIVNGFAKILSIYFFLVDHSIAGDITGGG